MTPPPRLPPAASLEDRVNVAVRANAVLFPLASLTSFVATVALVRTLGAQDYAVVAIGLALRTTLMFIADVSSSTGVAKLIAEEIAAGAASSVRVILRRYASVRLACFAATALILALAPHQVGEAVGLRPEELGLLWIVWLAALLESFATLGIFALQGLFDQRSVNYASIIGNVTQAGLIGVVALAGWGIVEALAAVAIASVLKLLYVAWRTSLQLRSIPTSRSGDVGWRRLVDVSAVVATGKLAGYLHSRGFLVLVVAGILERPELAVFALSADLAAQTSSVLISPVNGVVLPAFSEAAAKSQTRLRAIYQETTLLLATILGPVAIMAALLVAAFVGPLYGEEFAKAAVPSLLLIVAFTVEFTISAPANAALLALDSHREYVRSRLTAIPLLALYIPAMIVHEPLLVLAAALAASRLLLGLALAIAAARGKHALFPSPRGLYRVALWCLIAGSSGGGLLLAGNHSLWVAMTAGPTAAAVLLLTARPLRALDPCVVRRLGAVLPVLRRPLRVLGGHA